MKKLVFVSLLLWFFAVSYGFAFASSGLVWSNNNLFASGQTPTHSSLTKLTKMTLPASESIINVNWSKLIGKIQIFIINPANIWPEIGLVLALIYLLFAIYIKIFPKNFVGLRKINIYFIVIILGLMAWVIQAMFIAPSIKECNFYFFCYNFQMIILFEVFYALAIFYLMFGGINQINYRPSQLPITHSYRPYRPRKKLKSSK